MAMRIDQHDNRSERVGGPRRLYDAAQQAFDLAARFLAAFVIVEMHTDALRPTVLCTGRGDPDDGPGDRQFCRIVHQRQQHEHLVTDAVTAGGRDKYAASPKMRHESGV